MDQKTFESKRQQLHLVKRACISWVNQKLPPHQNQAYGGALISFLSISIFLFCVDSFVYKIGYFVVFTLSMIFGVLVFAYLNRTGTLPRTHADNLDMLLSSYEPTDAEAYKRLQDRVKRYGGFSVDEIGDWLREEEVANENAVGLHKPASNLFVQKHVL